MDRNVKRTETKMTEMQQNTTDTTVVLDVGGKRFRTTTDTLQRLPNTRLGRDATANKRKEQEMELFYDRNPKMMNCILDLYRTGELHLPNKLCGVVVIEELKFWDIPTDLISDCCWKIFESYKSDQEVKTELEHYLRQYPHLPAYSTAQCEPVPLRTKIWLMLEQPTSSTASKIWNFIFCVFVFVSIFSFIMETVPRFRNATCVLQEEYLEPNNLTLTQAYNSLKLAHYLAGTVPFIWLRVLRYVSLLFFMVDLSIRLIVCPDKKKFFRRARNWLEILVAVKTSLHVVMETVVLRNSLEDNTEAAVNASLGLYALSGIRAFRVLYLAKNFDSFKQIVILCCKSSSKLLLMLIVCCLSFVVLFGTAVYLAEAFSGLNNIPSIPVAMWWAIVTMTTVGYGDVVPVSVAGRMVGAVCSLSGVVVMALPIAIIVNSFSTYVDNMAPVKQRVARAAFLKDHPEFDFHSNSDEGQLKEIDSSADLSSFPELTFKKFEHSSTVHRNQVDSARGVKA